MKTKAILIVSMICLLWTFSYTNCSRRFEHDSLSSSLQSIKDNPQEKNLIKVEFQTKDSSTKEGRYGYVLLNRSGSDATLSNSELVVEVADQLNNHYVSTFAAGEESTSIRILFSPELITAIGDHLLLRIVDNKSEFDIGAQFDHRINISQNFSQTVVNLNKSEVQFNPDSTETPRQGFKILRQGGDQSQAMEIFLTGHDSSFKWNRLSEFFEISEGVAFEGGLKFTIPPGKNELPVNVKAKNNTPLGEDNQILFEIEAPQDPIYAVGEKNKIRIIETKILKSNNSPHTLLKVTPPNAASLVQIKTACSARAVKGQYCITDSSKTEAPKKCPAGKYCAGGTANPVNCGDGKYSLAGSAACTPCANKPTDMTYVSNVDYKGLTNSSAICAFEVTCKATGLRSHDKKNCTQQEKPFCSARAARGEYCTTDRSRTEDPKKCPAGKRCAGGTANPVNCGDGKYSLEGSTVCTSCTNKPDDMTYVSKVDYKGLTNSSAICAFEVTCKITGIRSSDKRNCTKKPSPGQPIPPPLSPLTEAQLALLLPDNIVNRNAGAGLHASNCFGCHGTSKMGRSYSDIKNAIKNISSMSRLLILSDQELFQISRFLNVTQDESVALIGTRTYVASYFSNIFLSDAGNARDDNSIKAVIKNNILSQIESFGGSCKPQDIDTLTGGDQTCLSLAAPDGEMLPKTNTMRRGYFTRTCEEILGYDQSIFNALQKVGLDTTATVDGAHVELIFDLFSPGRSLSAPAKAALLDIGTDTSLSNNNDKWRYVLYGICKSAGIEGI